MYIILVRKSVLYVLIPTKPRCNTENVIRKGKNVITSAK